MVPLQPGNLHDQRQENTSNIPRYTKPNPRPVIDQWKEPVSLRAVQARPPLSHLFESNSPHLGPSDIPGR